MITYKSRYLELGFYAGGQLRQFHGGIYRTDDPDEIAVLDALLDAEREASEDKPEEEAPKPARKRGPASAE